MQNVLHFIFARTWWTYDPQADWFAQPYHWINIVEGAAWLICAALVLGRFALHRRSWLELLYCFAFVTFGLSDFREAYVLQSWLIVFKGANLGALLYLRRLVLGRFYPVSRTV